MSLPPRPPDPNKGSASSRGDDAQPKDEGVLGGFFNRLVARALTPASDVDEFLRVVKRGDLAAVTAQLAAGMSPNAANSEGETALHLAAREGRVDVIAALAKAGANLNAGLKDNPARTPLQEAINFGQGSAAARLIACGGYPDNLQVVQELLHRACEKDMSEVVDAFARMGVDLCMPSAVQITPLMAALNSKKTAAAQTLLRAREVVAGLNAPLPGSSEGRTIFHLAVARADVAMVEAMILDGALVNLARDDGQTPLIMAINRGDVDIVRVLLAHGADAARPVMRNGAQVQPAPLMHLASIRNMNDTVREAMAALLIEAGADVNAVDSVNGSAPLHRLMMSSYAIGALRVFLRYGADVNMRDRAGFTPLMLSIESASLHDITNLLAAGADANARHDQDGRTPLMIAAALGQADTLRELLQAGANPRLLDNNGQSALFYAQANVSAKGKTTPVLTEALKRWVKPLFRGNTGPGGRVP